MTHPTQIRLARPEDAPGCLEIFRPVVLNTAISFETEVPSPQAFARRIEETLRAAPWLVCLRNGELCGYAYASQLRPRPAYRWSVEVTVYVGEEARGSGVGAALYRNLLAFLRAQGFVNAYAVITLPNPASVALHEKLGFRPFGVMKHVGYKLGQWHDIGWWELTLQQPAPHPASPLPPEEVLPEMVWEVPR